jgi:Golgi nucleoside diphosphatase
MTNLVKLDNSLGAVKSRENIMAVQHKIEELVASGKAKSGIEDRKLTHHFTEIDNDYNCCYMGVKCSCQKVL